jgi:predicted acylesterase/phospholipase RssA
MGELSTAHWLVRAQRVGILFAGGASRCVFQIGVVEVLLGLGVVPTVCLGVSGGAWNAAAVAAGNAHRLRAYWRFFSRMPSLDARNLRREHSPFRWRQLHDRAFRRYVGDARLAAAGAPRLLVALTRLRDRAPVVLDATAHRDPFRLLLASNYLPPFYTHPPVVDGERYGDAGFSDALPYEALFEHGCDGVVLIAAKGESEGGLYRGPHDFDHQIPAELLSRVVVIRPRHRLPLRFLERHWSRLAPIADLGALRAREVLLGETHVACDLATGGVAWTLRLARLSKALRFGGRLP